MNLSKTCRQADTTDINQVVNVHIAAFPGFFLTILGNRFIKVMYRAFLSSHSSIFIVDEENNNIHGFAVGILNSSEKDRNLALRFLPQFLLAITPALLRNPVTIIRRIIGKILNNGGQPNLPDETAVLRSIGVLPDKKGKGIADNLISSFEQAAKKRNAKSVTLTTDSENNERAIGFYLKHGYKIQEKFTQDGSRIMLLMVKNLS